MAVRKTKIGKAIRFTVSNGLLPSEAAIDKHLNVKHIPLNKVDRKKR